MKYAAEMDSGAMIQTGSGIQKLIGGIYRHRDRKEIT
jgi:hypothetical protein